MRGKSEPTDLSEAGVRNSRQSCGNRIPHIRIESPAFVKLSDILSVRITVMCSIVKQIYVLMRPSDAVEELRKHPDAGE